MGIDEKGRAAAIKAVGKARRMMTGGTLDFQPSDALLADAAVHAYESAKQKVAEGWVLVPREPTRRMVEILAYHPVAEGDRAQALDVYRAMIAAAPEPPSALLSAGGEG